MGSKSNVMVLTYFLHHKESQYHFRMVLGHFEFNHEKFTPPPLREARQKYWREQ